MIDVHLSFNQANFLSEPIPLHNLRTKSER